MTLRDAKRYTVSNQEGETKTLTASTFNQILVQFQALRDSEPDARWALTLGTVNKFRGLRFTG